MLVCIKLKQTTIANFTYFQNIYYILSANEHKTPIFNTVLRPYCAEL